MRNLRATLLLIASVGISAFAVPSPALAQSAPTGGSGASGAAGKEHAKKLFEEGVDLEKKADYAGALAPFKPGSTQCHARTPQDVAVVDAHLHMKTFAGVSIPYSDML